MTIEGDCVLDDSFHFQGAFVAARSSTEIKASLGNPIPSLSRIYHETSTKPS
jgi:hypothetical protein